MKKYSIFSILISAALILGCAQDIEDLKDPESEPEPTGSLGANIDVSNFVTIGNSLVAGYQSNALFTDGQNESIGKIIHRQMVYAGATGDFNQPDINSENGFSGFIPTTTIPLGRLVLYDPDGAGPRSAGPAASGTPERPAVTCPSAVAATPAVPAPYNTALSPLTADWAFDGDKDELNNFGVPGIQVGQLLTPDTGNPASPAFNPYWARFAKEPGVKTILQEAVAVSPTFLLVEVGNNDILGYATSGGANAAIFTSTADFTTRFNGVIATLMGLTTAKGVVANIPNVTTIPFFFTVKWNNVPPLANAADINGSLGTNYNGFLDLMVANSIITGAERDKRRLSYSATAANPILISDETLTDLSPYMTGPAAGLLPYARARHTTSTDLMTLTAGSVIGTCVSGNPQAVNGITIPLGDQYVLIPSETQEIMIRTAEFNGIIAAAVSANSTRLALADVNAAFTNFVSTQGAMMNGILLTPSITPPYAGFSEDGVHPNGRGYAFLANIFIDAINAKFGSTIPKANITQYRGTRTPISPMSSY